MSCSTQRNISKNKKINIATEDYINAQFYLYKNADTAAILYTSLNTYALLYARLDTGLQYYASIKIKVYLYSLSKNKADSVSETFYIPQNQTNYFNQLFLPVSYDNYNIKILVTDLNRKQQFTYFTDIKLSNDYTRNNFLITLNDKVLLKPYVYENTAIKIYHRQKYPQLFVDVFQYHHNAAPPPFSNFSPTLNYLPDSSFTLSLINHQYYTFTTQPNRFYHIHSSQNTMEGITLFTIDSVFPNIKNPKEMLYTTRYIMNKNEFERCNQSTDMIEIKKCMDNFWIQIAGSQERAKEIIKNYYQRVIEANEKFTTYKYGWQTDKGMIYIVFGPPEAVEKYQNSEKWFYSMNGQRNALVFNFYKNKNNPFTNSDFILERTDYYKNIWYIAVDKIRQGKLNTEK
ncbi:MAG: GWxTD domain-containing protein [Bacteroidia bacterium]|nr:GWxTD domain-containing protein [Bacteroidia bacterium]